MNVQTDYAGAVSDDESGEPPWLSAEQLESWRSLLSMLMTLPGAIDAQLKRDAGLNMFEYHVLVALADLSDGSMAMGELAQLTQGSPSRLSHAVGRMERAGWIERRSGEARCVNAHLTPAGRQKLVDSAPGHVREVRRLVIDSLSADQLRILGEAARVVAERADPVLACSLSRRADPVPAEPPPAQ